MNEQKNKKPLKNPFIMFLILSLAATVGLNILMSAITAPEEKDISYNEFLDMIRSDSIERVQINPPNILIYPKEEETQRPSGESVTDFLQVSPFASVKREVVYYTGYLDDSELLPLLNEHNISYERPVSSDNFLLDFFLTWILPLLVLYLLFFVFARYMSKKMGGGGIMGIGQSNAKVYMENKTGVTFAQVAGQEEAKESLREIVDFLHNPKKYTEIGAKQPKGALLVGPPGTGKTLLAKAVAGEANVPFFSLSGSEFVEMFVGVGASRVRSLFKDAAAKAPCIIFIDEIDAIGKSRDAQLSSNDEREQTLNQLLAEMDGFDSSKGVVILAATNRPEILDKALLRPGRFDRRIIVEKPDLKGRQAILEVHSKNVKLGPDVDLHEMALATSGAVGADLANMVNEAALHAVRMGRTAVAQEDLMEAVEVIIAGKEKKDRILSQKEKRIVAYHEVGHALATAIQKNTDPVQKITIVPRTMGALGYTMQMPEEEKFLMSRDEIIDQITVYLAGRCAEELIFNTQTTGAANDIEQATNLARCMVSQFGMSERFGMMGLESIEHKYLDGRAVSNCSEETKTAIDNEVIEILNSCHDKAMNILKENIDSLNKISEFLIEKETITGAEFMHILNEVRGTKLVIFDLDGTLTDTIDSIAHFGNLALSKYGFPVHETERYKKFAGNGRDTLIHRMLDASGNDTAENFEKVKEAYDEAYEADVMYGLKVFDGLSEAVERLRASGCLCAVLSNKPDNVAKDIIKTVFPENTFSLVIGQTDDRPMKPAPDGADYISKTLGVEKSECWFVGDTYVDISTGKNAGMKTIGVLWGFRDEEELRSAGADVIISEPKQLTEII